MGYDVLRQADDIAERAVLSHELSERKLAERVAVDLADGRTWQCRGSEVYLRGSLWPRLHSELCPWCSPAV